MRYIKKIAILISIRGTSLLGFFLLAFAMNGEDFKEYTLYFATWQIISQITGLQLGATLFRYGATPDSHEEAFYLFKALAKSAPIILTAFILSTAANITSIIPCIGMSLIYALFTCITEFARANTSENKVFALQSITGISYIGIFVISQALNKKISFNSVILIEGCAHLIAAALISWQLKPLSAKITYTSKKKSLRKLIPLWKKTSLPLIPNNIIWYIYFNSPQIISYFIPSTISEHNDRAILFRLVVAASTLSSILAIGTQKNLINLYESNPIVYRENKAETLKIRIPLTFIATLALAHLANKIYLELKPHPPKIYIYISGYITSISTLTAIFLAIYITSNFILSEKKMIVATKSMLLGLPVYFLSLPITLKHLSIEDAVLYGLIASLTVTLLSRYLSLLSKHS